MYHVHMYSLRPSLTELVYLFTHIKKNGFECLCKYWCIILYHKCKVEYIELGVVKVVLIIDIIGKNN